MPDRSTAARVIAVCSRTPQMHICAQRAFQGIDQCAIPDVGPLRDSLAFVGDVVGAADHQVDEQLMQP
ncbi:hypothetical protein BKG80_15315 [Mycobacteroides chelonae]|jgi:hypothetical protein|nr:hypothetical protein BKG80_15315 [Mycobacteroides chelonae]